MRIIISIVTVFLISYFSFAQTQKAKLFLRDGTIINGFAKIKDGGIIKFKKELTDKKKTNYNYKKIKSLEIIEKDKDTATYKYKIIPGSGTILLKVISEGESQICLYTYPIEMKNNGGYWSNGVFVSTGDNREFILNRYYIGKDSSSINVTKIWSDTNGKGNRYFRKTAPSFFTDCKALVDKIEDETFTKNNIKSIVEFYNENCDKN